ncbi:Calponin homology domain containing protein [Tylopilus felleus]
MVLTEAREEQRRYLSETMSPLATTLLVHTPGRVVKSTVLQALQSSGESYDHREILKGVPVDASGKVDLEDWVEAGKVTVKGSNANVSHTINEDERKESTNHTNAEHTCLPFLFVQVFENDPDIGYRFLIPTDTIDTRVLNIPTSRFLAQIDVKLHPEYRLCEEVETVDDLLRLTPNQILLRWFNYHLKAAGWKRRDLIQRTEQVLQTANIGCRKYLIPSPLVAGNPRLNLAFVANLFNTWSAKDYGAVEDFDAEGEREARVFTLWLNSLGVDPVVFNLFENLKDGLIILQASDKILPVSVVRRRSLDGGEEKEDIGITPNQSMLSRFKQAREAEWDAFGGIQGADIVNGIRTLVLGLVWQPMRLNVTKMEMLKWANSTVHNAKPTARAIRIFLDALRLGIVDPALVMCVQENEDYEEWRQNAKLAISITRKMNALIFLPEDIVDVRRRLILTFIESLMSIVH